MFNIRQNSWQWCGDDGTKFPEHNVRVFVLVEREVVLDVEIDVPFVRMASLHQYETEPKILYWKLLDYDPEYEEEILQQSNSVVAWRPVV